MLDAPKRRRAACELHMGRVVREVAGGGASRKSAKKSKFCRALN